MASGVPPALHCSHLLLSHSPLGFPTALTLVVSLSYLSLYISGMFYFGYILSTWLSPRDQNTDLSQFNLAFLNLQSQRIKRAVLTISALFKRKKKKKTEQCSLYPKLVLTSGQAYSDWESGTWKVFTTYPREVGERGEWVKMTSHMQWIFCFMILLSISLDPKLWQDQKLLFVLFCFYWLWYQAWLPFPELPSQVANTANRTLETTSLPI